MRDQEFTGANQIIEGINKSRRRQGLDVTQHKEAITEDDLKRMFQSPVLDSNDPWGLIHRVYFELSLHFARRGREGLRDLHKSSFHFLIDSKGREYVVMAYHEAEKTKQGNEKDILEKLGRMYSQDGPNCPIKSLKKLLSKLNPGLVNLFQYPSNRINASNSAHYSVWYDKKPLGKTPLDNMMSKISKEVPLSKVYTNHCVRATTCTTLARAGVDSAAIITVIGHRSTDSLKPYLRGPSEDQTHDMSSILHAASESNSAAPITPTGSCIPAASFPPATSYNPAASYTPASSHIPATPHTTAASSTPAAPESAVDVPSLAASRPTQSHTTDVNIMSSSHHQLTSIFTGTTFNGPVNISFYNH